MPAHLLFLLLTLVFLPPSRGCRHGSLAECHKARFVPGHHLVGEGFNIVTMETNGNSVVDVQHYMKGDTCTLCYNSLLREEQKLPVSVGAWNIKVRCKPSVSSRTFESSNSFLSSKSIKPSWMSGLGLKQLGGERCPASLFVQERSKKDTYSYSSLEFKCDYYSFQLSLLPPLSKKFENSLNRLPITQSTNHEAYKHFLDTYGTHYIRRVHLGGSVKTTTAIRKCKTAMNGVKASTISNCLYVEASANIKGVLHSPALNHCKKVSKKFGKSSFSAAFHDRITEVHGGEGDVANILLRSGEKSNYKRWLNTVKWVPGLVSYELSPLHMLVRDNPTLKSKLREAITGYIKHFAVPLKCTKKCKQGKPNKNCACKCSANGQVDGDCCPQRQGGAIITVTVIRAKNTWGDYVTGTDGYVRIKYGSKRYTSGVVWNNKNPKWNYKAVFLKTNLLSRRPIRVEVWDKDHGWDDDRLGWANIFPKKGTFTNKSYRLKHGRMYVSLSVVCLPRLTGSLCNQYLPEPETSPKRSLRMALDTSALPEGTLTTHNYKFM